MIDVEELHATAMRNNSKTYTDPVTGFTVFTEIVHLARGKCCGNRCRHCPYEWENVREQRRPRRGKRITYDSDDDTESVSDSDIDTDDSDSSDSDDEGSSARAERERSAPSSVICTSRDRIETASPSDDAVDEMCACLLAARAELDVEEEENELSELLSSVLDRLSEQNDDNEDYDELVLRLADWTRAPMEALPSRPAVVLPAGCTASARLRVAQAVCERAEREAARERREQRALLLGRLSGFLFAASRVVNHRRGLDENLYVTYV